MSRATVRKLLLAWAAQLDLFVGEVAAGAPADDELEVVRRWCGSTCGTECMLPLAWCVHFVLLVCLAVAGVVRFVVWDGVHIAACVSRSAGASCRQGRGGQAAGRGNGGGAVRRSKLRA